MSAIARATTAAAPDTDAPTDEPIDEPTDQPEDACQSVCASCDGICEGGECDDLNSASCTRCARRAGCSACLTCKQAPEDETAGHEGETVGEESGHKLSSENVDGGTATSNNTQKTVVVDRGSSVFVGYGAAFVCAVASVYSPQ